MSDDRRFRVTVEFDLEYNCNSCWADTSDIARDVASLVYHSMGSMGSKPSLDEPPKYLELCTWRKLVGIEEIDKP